jgi:hypothetical protein
MSVGSFTGALMAAGREKPRMQLLLGAALAFGTCLLFAAAMPSYRLFAVALFFVGLAALTFMTGSNSMMQLTTERGMRGRVLALRIAVVLAVSAGSTPLGAPLIGAVANAFGPRWSLVAGAASGFAAAFVGLRAMARRRRAAMAGAA